MRRVAAIREGTTYVYRQSAVDCNPQEVNSAVESLYLVCTEAGAPKKDEDEDEEEDTEGLLWSRVGTSALLSLVAHLVSQPTVTLHRPRLV